MFCGVYPASPATPASVTTGSQTIGFNVSVHTLSNANTKPARATKISPKAAQMTPFSTVE